MDEAQSEVLVDAEHEVEAEPEAAVDAEPLLFAKPAEKPRGFRPGDKVLCRGKGGVMTVEKVHKDYLTTRGGTGGYFILHKGFFTLIDEKD